MPSAAKCKYPKATADQFTASTFDSAKEKALTVNSVVAFLASGLDPDKLTKRAYHFFTIKLSMSACYNIDGFIATHLEGAESRRYFLAEVRSRVDDYAMLDVERGADMARLFCPMETYVREADDWADPGPCAKLLTEAAHGL